MNTAGLKKYKNAIPALVLIFCAGAANGQSETAQKDPNTPPQPSEQRDVEPQSTPEAVPLPVPDQSPFDYRSSEEISEDRSVSFPVDI